MPRKAHNNGLRTRVRPTMADQLAKDLTDTLARLRMARAVDPKHFVRTGDLHSGCEICVSERRLDWLLGRVPRKGLGIA